MPVKEKLNVEDISTSCHVLKRGRVTFKHVMARIIAVLVQLEGLLAVQCSAVFSLPVFYVPRRLPAIRIWE